MLKNRTTSLMYPFYSTFGQEFINSFNTVSNKYDNVVLYLGDTNYKSYNNFKDYDAFLNDDIIFVQVRVEVLNFERHYLLMQSHQNYVTDYETENGVMMVFKLDSSYAKALKYLKESKYSKMYDKKIIDGFFDESKFWYLKYKDEFQSASFNVFTSNKLTTLQQHKEKWESLDTTDFFNNIMLSPFHVMHKSDGLKQILEIAYGTEIPEENELIEKIKLEKEILHYDKSESNKDV